MEREGLEVEPPPYRCQATLTYLILNLDRPLRREKLTSELFPDLSASRARARLSDHLWLIKSALPGFGIETSGEEVRVASRQVRSDCTAFIAGMAQSNTEALYAALKLYQGDFAPNLYDDWVLLERERFRNAYVNSLTALATHFEKAGQHQSLIEVLNRLLIEEPFDEGAVRQLMRAYVRLGRRGLAISTYERFRLACVEQLSLEPEKDTQVLYESILARVTLPRPESESIPEVSEGNAGDILQQARAALNRGDRFQLLNFLRALSAIKDPPVALQRDLLHVDEAIQWADLSRAWQLLEAINIDAGPVDLRRAVLFLEQHNYEGAEQTLNRVLKNALGKDERSLEAGALIFLGAVKMQRASFQEAHLVVNRAMHIASQIDHPALITRACLQKGKIFIKQGINLDAQDVLLQAHALAENHHFSALLAEIDYHIAFSLQRNGRHHGAYKIYLTALEFARDAGLKKLEAQILLGQAAVCDFLGRNEESLQALNAARTIYAEMDDQLGLATVDYNLAAAFPYHDENRCAEAITYARAALKTFIAFEQVEWQAVAYTALAFALWADGQYPPAINNFKKSIELHRSLGEANFIPELSAYVGLAHLGAGDLTAALDWTEQACYEQALLNLSDIVADIFYARGAALEQFGHIDEARHFYLKAYDTLLDYAKDIEDETARLAYFHRDPITRRLMHKVQALGLSPGARQMVVARNISGEKLDIAITIDAGASDRALAKGQGAVALRRVRLKRLLHEANIQNTRLTLAELAQALDVSQRTVQRDLEVLKSQDVE